MTTQPDSQTVPDRSHAHPVDPERVDHARARVPALDDIVRLTSLLSLMADPVRLRILYALDVSDQLCVRDLALALDINEDQVTYALRLLRTAGLVQTRKQGRVVFNRLATDFPEPLRERCLRQLVELTRRPADLDLEPSVTKPLIRVGLLTAEATASAQARNGMLGR